MTRKRHAVWAGFSGFFAGLFIGLSLLFMGVIPLESIWLVVLPIAWTLLALVLAFTIKRGDRAQPRETESRDPHAVVQDYLLPGAPVRVVETDRDPEPEPEPESEPEPEPENEPEQDPE